MAATTHGDDLSCQKSILKRRKGRIRKSSTSMLFATTALHAFLVLAVAHHVNVNAWIPPRPGTQVAVDWESVHATRQRLGIAFNYTPSLLHPEICRYMTQDECQDGDQSMVVHAKSHRKLQTERGHNPNLGTFKVLVLLIVFEDHTDRPLIEKTDVELMWNTLVPEWFDVNSHGNYEVEPFVTDWVVTDNTEDYYSFGKTGVVPDFQKAAWPALDALDNTAGWDWSIFDLDKDGKLDSVVITHSGYGAETVRIDQYGRPHTDRIWAHAFATSADSWTSRDGSVTLGGYTVASAFEDDKGVIPATIGLTIHEYMHTFAIIDLYDTTNPSLGSGIGGYDIMANPYGPNGNANFPGHLSTWSKIEAEWALPTEITQDGIYSLQPLETTNEGYQIMLGSRGTFKEYLLLENRQKIEFDLYLYGAGLAIYHVDDAMDGQKYRGFPGQVDDMGNSWPGNGLHYEVAMLQADGLYELEQAQDRGDKGDMWQPGDILGPGEGGTVYPSTDSYQAGCTDSHRNAIIRETGITITVLEADDAQEVKFQVSGLGGGDGEGGNTPAETAVPTKSPTTTTPATDVPTKSPTTAPTDVPATDAPISASPTTGVSTTASTTTAPGNPTQFPTMAPTTTPTQSTAASPTAARTMNPTAGDTAPLVNSNPGETLAPTEATNPSELISSDSGGVVATDGESITLAPETNSPTQTPYFSAVDMSSNSNGGTEQASGNYGGEENQREGGAASQMSSAPASDKQQCLTMIGTTSMSLLVLMYSTNS